MSEPVATEEVVEKIKQLQSNIVLGTDDPKLVNDLDVLVRLALQEIEAKTGEVVVAEDTVANLEIELHHHENLVADLEQRIMDLQGAR